MLCKKIKLYFVNRKLKKLNQNIANAPDIKSFLKLENLRLDLIGKVNKIKGKTK